MLVTKTKPGEIAPFEVEKLRERLEELEETLRAIRGGEVDALVVSGPEGDQVFTLQGAEYPYRVLVETMSEGAATVTRDGTILYCNGRLAEMLETPLEKLLGYSLYAYIAEEGRSELAGLLDCGLRTSIKDEMRFKTGRGASLPVYLSLSPYRKEQMQVICLVVTDLTEQKRNEEIVAAERLARSILEQAAEAIVVCDTEGRIIRANEAAQRLSGQNPILQPFESVFPVELASGQPFEPCATDATQVYPDARKRRFTVSAALGRQAVRQVEAEFRRKDGEVFHLLLSARLLLGTSHEASPEGDVRGCVIVLTDITGRTRTEQALRQSEERLRLATQGGHIGISEWDIKTDKVVWSDQMCAIYGVPAGSFGGDYKSFLELVHPDDRGRVHQAIKTALENGSPHDLEFRSVRPNDETRWILGRGQMFRDEVGNPSRLMGIAVDITERKRAEEALRQSELRFRRLAESNIIGIIWGEGDLIKEANDAFLQTIRYSRGDLQEGKIDWRSMIPPEYSPRAERAQQEHRQQGFWTPFEKEYIRKDGSRVPILVGGTVVTRSPLTWVAFVLDLTDRKRAEAALQAEHRELELRVKERTAELARTNEELRTEVAERVCAQRALHLLVEVDVAARGAEDIKTITSASLEKICKLTGWQVGQAWFVNEQENALVCVQDAFYAGFDVTNFRKASLRTRLHRGRGLPGCVWKAGAPASIADVTKDPNFLRAGAARKSGLRGAFAFPVKMGEKLLAIFEFFSPEAREPDPYFLDAVDKLGSHLAIAYDRKRAEEELRRLSVRLLHLQDEERRRLGRELHDSTGQGLAALAMNLGAVSRSSNGIDRRARRLLSESLRLAKQCAQEIRTFSYLLHPPQLDREGLASALGWYAQGFTERSGINIKLDVAPNLGRLCPEAEMALYRIVQESLANIHRHSGSRSAKIRISRHRGAIKLEVKDYGRGIPAGVLEGMVKGASALGVGIPGMRERVAQLGGRLQIGTGKRGTALKVVLPLPRGS